MSRRGGRQGSGLEAPDPTMGGATHRLVRRPWSRWGAPQEVHYVPSRGFLWRRTTFPLAPRAAMWGATGRGPCRPTSLPLAPRQGSFGVQHRPVWRPWQACMAPQVPSLAAKGPFLRRHTSLPSALSFHPIGAIRATTGRHVPTRSRPHARRTQDSGPVPERSCQEARRLTTHRTALECREWPCGDGPAEHGSPRPWRRCSPRGRDRSGCRHHPRGTGRPASAGSAPSTACSPATRRSSRSRRRCRRVRCRRGHAGDAAECATCPARRVRVREGARVDGRGRGEGASRGSCGSCGLERGVESRRAWTRAGEGRRELHGVRHRDVVCDHRDRG